MKKTIKSFVILIGTLVMISCNTPLDVNVSESSNENTEIINEEDKHDEDEVNVDNTENDKEISNSENELNDNSETTDDVENNDLNENNSESENTEIIIDDENEEISNENEETSNEEIPNEVDNNGILNYTFDENAIITDFDYIIYYNDTIMNWSYRSFTDSKKGTVIIVDNHFNIRIDISTSSITVITYYGCPRNIQVKNVEVNNNNIIIKISSN